METKNNVKVVQIDFDREWSPKDKDFTIFYFNIELEDGTKGFFSTNKREQTKFEVGKSYNITTEKKQSKNGEQIKIDIVREKSGGYKYDPEVQKQIVKGAALRCAIETILYSDIIEVDQIKPLTRNYEAWINAKGLGNKQMSINRQSALSRAIMSLQIMLDEDKENKMSYDEIIKMADNYFKYINGND